VYFNHTQKVHPLKHFVPCFFSFISAKLNRITPNGGAKCMCGRLNAGAVAYWSSVNYDGRINSTKKGVMFIA